MIAFALGRSSAEIQAKQIGVADPFAIKEERQLESGVNELTDPLLLCKSARQRSDENYQPEDA